MNRRCAIKTCIYKSCPGIGFRHGTFRRSSDSKVLQRWKCNHCHKTFSQATTSLCYRQKKRRLNRWVLKKLRSGVSIRQTAYELHIHRTTVMRKMAFWSMICREKQKRFLSKYLAQSDMKPSRSLQPVYFDDIETFEATKKKPLSISVVVSSDRVILGYRVSQMPCKGRLSEKSVKKYGPRIDKRPAGWEDLWAKMARLLPAQTPIISDENPHYLKVIKRHFPKAQHIGYKGRKPRDMGLGELKVGGYDPLFKINHTAARIRDLNKRLSRKTWCTTKTVRGLCQQLDIFVQSHNCRVWEMKQRKIRVADWRGDSS